MKIIVTSGATREYIDGVRFISNNSTGQLGCMIAAKALKQELEVIYIHGVGAPLPDQKNMLYVKPVTSTQDLVLAMEQALADSSVKAVIHPMAVSDFTPSDVITGKVSSDGDKLVLTLVPTPKVINTVKEKRPDVFLVSFKLETGVSEEELIQKAEKSLVATGSDIVAANLLEQTGLETHKAVFVGPEGLIGSAQGKADIAAYLVSLVKDCIQ
jgi:phosphopantothenoylcysteine synthetase/decarboxylase